mgnify:CR=1 FL=1
MLRLINDTCKECAEYGEFNIDDDVIRSPGKFEAECDYVIHFYHMMLDGFGNMCACGSDYFEVTAEDAALFPSLADSVGGIVHLSESEVGFLYCEVVSQGEFESHETEAAETEEVEIN